MYAEAISALAVKKDYSATLRRFEKFLLANGYRPSDAHYKPHVDARASADGGFIVSMESLSPDIRYTTAGTAPGRDSAVYRGPFSTAGDVTVRAASLRPDGTLLGAERLSLVDHIGRGASTYPGQSPQAGRGDFAAVLVDGRITGACTGRRRLRWSARMPRAIG